MGTPSSPANALAYQSGTPGAPVARLRRLRIGILGTRGIPAAYGGFETFAEQLAVRLAARGHEVSVYCREGSTDRAWNGQRYRGVRLVVLPAPRSKHLETVVHGIRSAIRAVRDGLDVALVCNAANFAALPILRAAGIRSMLAMDGLESERRKWGFAGRTFHRVAARLGPALADAIVADCRVIQEHYRARGVSRVEMIAYGAEPPRTTGTGMLRTLGVRPREYVLYVARLERENNADLVLRAFRAARSGHDLVLVGDAPYADAFKAELREIAGGDPHVKFAGFVFGAGYDELRAHAALYVQASDVGGTHPALLEAMAAGLPIVANDIPEHREVLGDAGWYFERNSSGSLAARLAWLLGPDAAAERERLERGAAARARVARLYAWDAVTTEYERLAGALVDGGSTGSSTGPRLDPPAPPARTAVARAAGASP